MKFQIKTKGGEAGVLNKQVETFLNELPKPDNPPPLVEVPPQAIRMAPSTTAPLNLDPAHVAIEEIAITARDGHQVKIRIYRQNEDSTGAPLIYFHGGCWIFCNIDTHDSVCRQLCQDTGKTVFSVDYRLAPEHKFPTGIQDSYDAALWISQNNELLNTTDDDLLVCGDSAGGNISTVVTLMALESKEFKVRGQMLFYPITDISRIDTISYEKFKKDYFLTKELMEYGSNHYINNEADRRNPLISPLLSKNLSAMPKTLIQTAEFDVLRDEAEAYAEKLANAGVDVECVRYNGLIHAYINLAGRVTQGREAMNDAAVFFNSFK